MRWTFLCAVLWAGCGDAENKSATEPETEAGGAASTDDDGSATDPGNEDTESPTGSDTDASQDSGSMDAPDTSSPIFWPGSELTDRQAVADAMVEAAQAFLAGLDDYQRGQVQYSLTDAERSDWSNLPHAIHVREGVSFAELNEERMNLGWELIRASLSAAGVKRAQDIIQLEKLLWEDGDMNAFPGNYFFTFFDTPSQTEPWGWQLDGHHLALNFTVVGPEVTITPSLWGVSPKVWPTGEFMGLAPMAAEEDLAFGWMASLNEDQMGQAQLSADADPDLMAGPTSIQSEWPEPRGVPVSALDESQREALLEWIAVYVGNLADAQSAERMAEIEASLGDASVAWMGGTTPGEMMYYRIQGSKVLIEYDHTRSADHVHAVYRDPSNDYGVNWLAKHLAEHHAGE